MARDTKSSAKVLKKPKVKIKKPLPEKSSRKLRNATQASISTENKYDDLDNDIDVDSIAETVVQIKKGKMKPIILDMDQRKMTEIQQMLTTAELKDQTLFKKTRDNKVHIITNSYEDKQKLLNHLNTAKSNENSINYHTFSESNEKVSIFVIKNFIPMKNEDLLTKLIEMEVPAKKVTQIGKNKENPVFLIQFEKNQVEFNTLQYNHNIIDNIIVKWEKFNYKKKPPAQCHNCQAYGHSARNCGRAYKCVKCINVHRPGECERKTTEGNPQCSNCKEFHAANSKLCKYYKEYITKIESLKVKTKTIPRSFRSTPAPWNNFSQYHSQFPEIIPQTQSPNVFSNTQTPQNRINLNNLNSSQDYVVKNDSQTFNEIDNLNNQFNAIPGIKKTLELYRELIQKLKNTSCDKTRLSILIQYTMP